MLLFGGGGNWGGGDGVLGFFGVAYYVYNLLKKWKLVHTSFKVDYCHPYTVLKIIE